MKKQEIEAMGYDYEEFERIRKEYDLTADDVRYLMDNGFTMKTLEEKGFDPDWMEEIFCDRTAGVQYFLLESGYRYKLRGGTPIDTQTAEKVFERFGYKMSVEDLELAQQIGMGFDDINWAGDYSHRYNPKIYGRVKNWAEDQYIQLLPPPLVHGLLASMEPGETITF